MPSIGPLELAIVLIIALVVFGPKRLPELGKSLGNGMREFKSSISGDDDRDHADEDDADEDDREPATAAQPQLTALTAPQPDADSADVREARTGA